MQIFKLDDVKAAHKHSSRHRNEILNSSVCGCFFCMSVFKPCEILDWVNDGDISIYPELEASCALCPKCGIDAVIGSNSGYPVIDKVSLKEMNSYWF